jgi:hypothetical protein
LGNSQHNRGLAPPPGRAFWAIRRAGKANSDVIIALALVAVVAFLMQVQSGAIDISGLGAKAGTGKAPTGEGGSPGLIVLAEAPQSADPFAIAADAFILERGRQLEAQRLTDWRVRAGLAWSDAEAGARLLEQLSPSAAAGLLGSLPPRSAARILGASDPQIAAKWYELLASPEPLAPVPDELKARAASAGLYDNSSELLEAARAQAGAPPQGAAGVAEGTAGGP